MRRSRVSSHASPVWKVELGPAAEQGLHALSEAERADALHALGRRTLGPEPPGPPEPYRLRNRPDRTVPRAGARLGVAYTAEANGSLVVVDVVAHGRAADHPAAPVAATA